MNKNQIKESADKTKAHFHMDELLLQIKLGCDVRPAGGAAE